MGRALTADVRIIMAAIADGARPTLEGVMANNEMSRAKTAMLLRALRWRGMIPWTPTMQADPAADTSREPEAGARRNRTARIANPAEPQLVPTAPPRARRAEPLKIGDVLPLDDDFDREAWIQQKRRLLAMRKTPTSRIRATLKLPADQAADAEHARRECPVEQAKTIIRRTGVPVFAASVVDRKAKGYQVGARRLSEQELLAYAAEIRKRAERTSARS
jgi:hypothetical protein